MIRGRLTTGAQAMGIRLTDGMVDQMARYHALLEEGNRRMNLTRAMDDPIEAVDRHFLDSLTPMAVPGLMDGAKTLIDVGSGAGLPGIPLAIALPHVRVTMLDSLNKRVGFLNEVIAQLGLNAAAVHARAEDLARDRRYFGAFDIVTARAVASLNVLAELSLPFARVGGRMIAYKGPSLDGELADARRAIAALGGGKAAVHAAHIPGRDWDHRLLVIEKIKPTGAAYPRKAGEAARNPIL